MCQCFLHRRECRRGGRRTTRWLLCRNAGWWWPTAVDATSWCTRRARGLIPFHLYRLRQPWSFSPLFLGGEVNLIGVVSTISSLLAGTSTSRSRATGTAVVGLHVLGRSPVAGALAGGTGTAGATGTGDGVLLGGLVAGAVQSRLLAAGALGLLGTDTGVALAAAGGRLGNFGGHC